MRTLPRSRVDAVALAQSNVIAAAINASAIGTDRSRNVLAALIATIEIPSMTKELLTHTCEMI